MTSERELTGCSVNTVAQDKGARHVVQQWLHEGTECDGVICAISNSGDVDCLYGDVVHQDALHMALAAAPGWSKCGSEPRRWREQLLLGQ